MALVIASFVAWAAIADIDEIARGEGKVIPVSKTQIIQSSEPGVVQQIAVGLGQVVRKGQLLVQLDNTTTTSSLGESGRQGARAGRQGRAPEARGSQARYDAPIICPAGDLWRLPRRSATTKRSLFAADRASYQNKLGVLQERVRQRENELNEAHANIDRLQQNIDRRAAPVRPDPVRWRRRSWYAQTEVLKVERDLTDQQGQLKVYRGKPRSPGGRRSGGQASARRSGAGAPPAGADREGAARWPSCSVVDETIRGASDRVKRTDIRSPVDGIVNTLEVNTIGAYVQPGRVIAGIVPTADTLLVEAKISPRDVAFVRRGQPAMVKVTAYDFSIFGGLEGSVENISADSLVEKEKGETYLSRPGEDRRVGARAQRKGLSASSRYGRLGRNHDRQQDGPQLPPEADQQGAHQRR